MLLADRLKACRLGEKDLTCLEFSQPRATQTSYNYYSNYFVFLFNYSFFSSSFKVSCIL